jgi:hypothetical protein
MTRDPEKLWNPYLAGVALGLVLLGSYVVMGKGLGASGASYRLGVAAVEAVAPSHAATAPGLRSATAAGSPLDDWIVFEFLGMFLGGLVAAYTSGRMSREVLRGPHISAGGRLALAFGGAVLMGIGAKMARGCASGQALTGGGIMSVGGWVFMLAFFGGAYALAWFVRREYR